MRTSHPGCGRPAGGKGYNSGGNYCGGWAGNCGDGGVGGSSWYLICEKCREAHQKQSVSTVDQGGPADKASADPNSSRLRLNSNMQKSLSAMVKLRKKSTASLMMPPSAKMISPSGGQLSSHRIMHNNAMFLLDLASSANNINSNLVRPNQPVSQQQPQPPPPPTSVAIGGARSKIPPPSVSQPLSAVSELSNLDPNPFPLVPFQCFGALGVQV